MLFVVYKKGLKTYQGGEDLGQMKQVDAQQSMENALGLGFHI
jgi:hypothetical protein